MSIRLKLIKDPKDPNAKSIEMPVFLTMRNVEPQIVVNEKDGKSVEQKIQISEEAVNLAKKETIKRFEKRVNIQEVLNRVREGIEQKVTRKTYYVGSQSNKLFCGPVLQIIPISTLGQIGGGKSTYIKKPPLKDNQFQFQKHRQISIKVGKTVAKDYVIVVARNGCVILEPNAYALLNMPIYVVAPTGEYFYLNYGNRSLDLGPGTHFVLYTLEAPVIFATVLKHEIIREEPKPMNVDLKSELQRVIEERKKQKELKETQESEQKPKEEKTEKTDSESDKSNEIKSKEKAQIEVKTTDQKEKSDEKEKKKIESKSDEDSDKKIESNQQKSSTVDFKSDSLPIKEEPKEQTETENKPKTEEKPEINVESEPEVKEETKAKPKSEVKPVARVKQLKEETAVKQPVEPIAEPQPQNLQQRPHPKRRLLIGIVVFAVLVSSVVFLYLMKRNNRNH